MRRGVRGGLSLALGVLSGTFFVASCHEYQVLEYAENPPRTWDIAWLQPLDPQGRPIQEPQRFELEAAGVDLVEAAAGFVVVGVALDGLSAQDRVRVDRASLERATLEPELGATGLEAAPVRISDDGAWMELTVERGRSHFDLIGPRSFDPDETISSSVSFGLEVRLPILADYCRPVVAQRRTLVFEGDNEALRNRHVVELRSLPGGALMAAVDAVMSGLSLVHAGALVRVRPDGRVTDLDRVFLPAPNFEGATAQALTHLALRPRTSSSTITSVWAVQIDGRRVPAVEQESRLLGLDLPHEGDWNDRPMTQVTVRGPLAGSHTQAAQGVAESVDGDVLVLGGRNDDTTSVPEPHGFVGISPGRSSSISFALHDVTFSGSTNGDILYRAVALPPDPARPEHSRFALGARRGEVLLVDYDARDDALREVQRYAPPPDITVKVGVGYQFMHVVPRPGGYELWAVGLQSMLLRRTVDGRWQILTDLIRDGQLADRSARPCLPVGYPRGREAMNIARGEHSALVTLANCSGALLLRFDEDDELVCATGVRPAEQDQLEVVEGQDFDAVTAVPGGYSMVRTDRFELYFVPEEAP